MNLKEGMLFVSSLNNAYFPILWIGLRILPTNYSSCTIVLFVRVQYLYSCWRIITRRNDGVVFISFGIANEKLLKTSERFLQRRLQCRRHLQGVRRRRRPDGRTGDDYDSTT